MNKVHGIKEFTKKTELKNKYCTQNERINNVNRTKEWTKHTELKSE